MNSAVDALDVGIDRNDGQSFAETGLDENRSVVGTRNRPVHQRMPLDEVEARFRKGEGVVVAKSGPGIGNLRTGGRKPIRVDGLLVLERPVLERGQDVRELEAANGRSGDGVIRRGEDSVKDLLVLGRSAIDRIGSFDESGRRLNLVEVEGEVARN